MKKRISLIVLCVIASSVFALSRKERLARRRKKSLVEHFSIQTAIDTSGAVDQVVETAAEIAQEVVGQRESQEQKNKTNTDVEDTENVGKRADCVALVERGVEYLAEHSFFTACNTFTHDASFKKGELYLFIFDTQGTCFANGGQPDLVGKNLYDMRDDYGTLVVQEILQAAKNGATWVTYRWRNATKSTYVREVRKGDTTYVVGAGYYPHSKADAVVSLVKGAVALFNDVVSSGRSKDEALSSLSYPLGRFIFGDLYLYALDFEGLQVAHGELPGIIGTNAWNYKDSHGLYVNQEIVKKLKVLDAGGVWVEYISKNAPKRAYAEAVTDSDGRRYFIASGYYPDADRSQAVTLVRRGYQYMKRNGLSQSVRMFSDRRNKEFRYGDLFLIVYGMKGEKKGKVVAHGGNESLIGQNHFDRKDGDGNYYVQEFIKKAEDGGGWVNYKYKNTFGSAYVERVDLGVDEFVIGAGLYPISKQETMELLAKTGASYLRSNDVEVACRAFTKKNGSFIRGDLSVFMFDADGLCYAHGDEYDLIWKNLISAVDQNGKEYVKLFINVAKSGADYVTYQMNDAERTAYIEPVEKDRRLYVVGSAYFK